MKKMILFFFLLCQSPLFALLSPLEQSLSELQQIMNSDKLRQSLPADEKIYTIIATPRGYLVSTKEYQMLVEIHILPPNKPGPAKIQLIFHEPEKI